MSFDIYTLSGLAIVVAEAFATIISIIVAVRRKSKIALSSVQALIPLLTRQANALLGSKTGAAKLQYVLSQLRAQCAELSIDFDPEAWSSVIEYYLGADSSEGVSYETFQNPQVERPEDLSQNRDEDKKDQRRTRYDARRD